MPELQYIKSTKCFHQLETCFVNLVFAADPFLWMNMKAACKELAIYYHLFTAVKPNTNNKYNVKTFLHAKHYNFYRQRTAPYKC